MNTRTEARTLPATMSRLFNILSVAIIAVSTNWIASAHDIVPGTPQAGPILLKNAVVHTVSGQTIDNGSVLFDQGKIIGVGVDLTVPEGCNVLDLEGKHVYPGLISSYSMTGLVEINAVRATRDFAETGNINTNAKAETAFNPDSEVIPVSRANGVLSVHVVPRGGRISGTTAVVNLDGWTVEEMLVKSSAGVMINWPWAPSASDFDVHQDFVAQPDLDEENYQKAIKSLNDYFENVQAFGRFIKTDPALDLRQEALLPAINGERLVFIQADRARQIRDAINWIREEGVKAVIVGGSDAWMLADSLAENSVPVILVGVNKLPQTRWERYDTPFRNAKVLQDAGVDFAIATSGDFGNERNLPYEAGKSVAYGLSPEEALKAITLSPARILGVDDRLGSLEVGKDANLFITDGDPLDIRTQVEQAFIQGSTVDLSSRHTQLYEKYQQKYK